MHVYIVVLNMLRSGLEITDNEEANVFTLSCSAGCWSTTLMKRNPQSALSVDLPYVGHSQL